MSKEFIADQKEKYLKSFKEHGYTAKGVLCNDTNSQYLRFERLLKNFNLMNKFSIHDIGCGTAALHEYLNERGIEHDYHGTEIVPEIIEAVKKKHPSINITERDILTAGTIETCDIAVVSGIFYVAGNQIQEEWKEYVFNMLRKIFEISGKGMAVNFLTSYRTFTDKALSYFDPAEIMDFCIRELSRYVIIDQAYPLYEFTVTVLKSSEIKEQYPGKEFLKYYKNDT